MIASADPTWLALACCLGLTTLVWIASVIRRNAALIDIFWGPLFVVGAWVHLLAAGGGTTRARWIVGLVTLWGTRLALHILLRARGKGEDYRYAAMREHRGPSFAWISLFTIFWLQGALAWLLSMPLYRAAAAPRPEALGTLDLLATAVFVAGFLFEAIADLQLVRFKADPANRGKLLTTGLWRYSRHPNYFGEALLWVGIGLFALGTPGAWWTLYAPPLMILLVMRVSGVPLLEKRMAATKPGHREYIERTNAFLPWFPREKPG